VFCENCGTTVRDGSEFCTSCGTKVAVTGDAAAPRTGAESKVPESDGLAEVLNVYKVVSFQASISSTGSGQDVAAALQRAIDQEATSGWEFVQIQELTTFVAGNSGCFGLGATPGTTTSLAVLIFKRK
jgi:zinc-ribbon domain/Domain of unknown function (DUF4177)